MGKKEFKEERMKILELLSKGVITAEEAENLLTAMGGNTQEPEVSFTPATKKSQFKLLKVYVDSADGDEVRVELPIEFAKLLKSGSIKQLDKEGLDIDVDMLIQMINSGVVGEIVNVKSADGDIVKVIVE